VTGTDGAPTAHRAARPRRCHPEGRASVVSHAPPPDWPACATEGCIGIRLDGRRACLAHVGEEACKSYLARLYPRASVDLRGTPISAALLREVLAATSTAEGVAVLADVRFERAEFTGDAVFNLAQFTGAVGFDGAQFTRDALFTGTQFIRDALFSGTQFSGTAGFDDARFAGNAGFGSAEFARDAEFYNARFAGNAGFDWVRFAGDVGFGSAEFARDAVFEGARFDRAQQLGPILVTGALNLDYAVFTKRVEIAAIAYAISCARTQFTGGAALEVGFAGVALDDTQFLAPSRLVAVASHGFSQEQLRQVAGPHHPGGAFHPRLLSLRGTDVANLWLSNVDLGVCAFTGAQNLQTLRAEVAGIPSPRAGIQGGRGCPSGGGRDAMRW
jgi:hypothetical protein